MKKTHFFSRFKMFALLVFCCFLVLTTVETWAAEVVEGEYIIKFRPCDVPMDSIKLIIGEPLKVFSAVDANLVKLDKVRTRSQSEQISQLLANPCVEYVEPNYILTLEKTELSRKAPGLRKKPNDPDFLNESLWGLDKIEAEKAWDISTGHHEEVIVAVIDSGVDYEHPDLKANMWINTKEIPGNDIDDDANRCIDDVHGCDFTKVVNGGATGEPLDKDSHGTHVAGIIAAVGNNGVGIVGVNWSAKIMAIKIVNNYHLSTSDAISAINYAQRMGAKIINSSWHIKAKDKPKALYDAIKSVKDAGILFVTTAGNNSNNIDPFDNPYTCLQCPASFDLDNIISVAATDRNDKLLNRSNFGLNSVDIGAPGEDIYSTVLSHLKPPYSFDSGTSMAAPHVAGVAALLWSLKPHLTYRQVKEAILSTVDPVDSLDGKTVTGGRLNAYKALMTDDSNTRSFNNVPVALCKVFVDEFKVKLDATDSFGNIQRYNWIISSGLDSNNEVGPIGAIIDLELNRAGTYTVKLSVTDHKGLTDETLCDFTVPQAPKPVLRTCMITSAIQGTAKSIYSDNLVPIQGTAPLTVQVQGPENVEQCQPDSFLDSIDSIDSTESIVQYIWTVCKKAKDGTCLSQPVSGDQKTFSRTFESSGTYELKVTVTGKEGTMITSKFEVNVLPTLASISPTASFAGGISINGEDYQTALRLDSITDDVIDITGQIKVDSRHIGLLADILVVYVDSQTQELYMLDNQGVPYLYEVGKPLVFFQPNVRLETIQKVSIYNGSVPTNRLYFFGYLLKNYTLVYNNQPIEITMN